MNALSLFPTAAANHLAKAAAASSTTASSTSSSSTADSSTISSSDFLTLLVTEMKNQDPTQPSDPTQYVQQLVGVNSLEQLIDVNTQLTSLGGSLATSTSSST